MNNPKVIISVLNWIRYSDTIGCLQHISDQQYSDYEIIVIDNGSFNESVDMIKRSFPGVNIIRLKKNVGFAAGHKVSADIAIRQNAELLWILNPDTKVRTDSLNQLVKSYQKHGNAVYGSITLKSEQPDVVSFGGGQEIKNLPDEIPFSYNLFENRLLNDCKKELFERRVQSVEGCSMLIPVDMIRKYGFMDTRFFLYGEETDYCLHLWKEGIPSIVVPSSIVVHEGASSFDQLHEQNIVRTYYRTRNWRIIARKYFGVSGSQILKSKGGWKAFSKFYLLWLFAGKNFRTENRLLYFENLAVLHALLKIMGKKVKPEKYFSAINQT
jgi:GT2 family glycosyltransferase